MSSLSRGQVTPPLLEVGATFGNGRSISESPGAKTAMAAEAVPRDLLVGLEILTGDRRVTDNRGNGFVSEG